jgi:hypothetical protein
MESNRVQERIQVSEASAKLLIAAGKGHWVTAPDDLVWAKGKGNMQIYWVTVQNVYTSMKMHRFKRQHRLMQAHTFVNFVLIYYCHSKRINYLVLI